MSTDQVFAGFMVDKEQRVFKVGYFRFWSTEGCALLSNVGQKLKEGGSGGFLAIYDLGNGRRKQLSLGVEY